MSYLWLYLLSCDDGGDSEGSLSVISTPASGPPSPPDPDELEPEGDDREGEVVGLGGTPLEKSFLSLETKFYLSTELLIIPALYKVALHLS